MVRVCAFPNCGNRMRRYKCLHFHRLPFHDHEILQLWLVVLQLDVQTPIQVLCEKDLCICSEHFEEDDYRDTTQRGRLKRNAVPRMKTAATTVEVMLYS
uniref:THAP domain-containing protein 1 n=1 Tax=Dicentrarchus labrax TaxID=13489 RepID=A0A8C4DI62_DICLA